MLEISEDKIFIPFAFFLNSTQLNCTTFKSILNIYIFYYPTLRYDHPRKIKTLIVYFTFFFKKKQLPNCCSASLDNTFCFH